MSNASWVKIDVRALFDGIYGDIIPSLERSSNYSSDIYIRPSNISMAKISVVPPTIYKKQLIPTKDTYINSNKVVLNYGTEQSLLVDKNKANSYMSFSLKDIPENAVIESAKLCFYKENYTNSINLKLANTSDDYEEIGLTYLNNQGIDTDLFEIQLPNESSYVSIDMLYYVLNWYENTHYEDKAFVFKTSNDEPIIITSKEGRNKPYLEVEYYIKNQNIGVSEVYGELYPICIRDIEIDNEIFVESNTRELYIQGEINIISIQNQLDIDGCIETINSSILEYNAETNILQYSNTLKTEINEIVPNILREIELFAETNILTQTANVEILGEILQLFPGETTFNGEINILRQIGSTETYGEILESHVRTINYNGEIYVKQQSGQVSHVGSLLPLINKTTEYTGEINIVKINAEYHHDGEINIILQQENVEYTGEIAPIIEVVFDGEINIVTQTANFEQPSEIYIKLIEESIEYEGEIEPSILSYVDLDCEIDINNIGFSWLYYDAEIMIAAPNITKGYVFIL